MRKAKFYTKDKSPFEMWVEKTPQSGEQEIRLHVYRDAIDFCYEDWSKYKNKLPLVIEQDNGAIVLVWVVVKYGDVFLKRELQSGERQATKIVRIASPVYYIKKPRYSDIKERVTTYKKGSSVKLLAAYNFPNQNPFSPSCFIKTGTEKEEGYQFMNMEAFGPLIGVVGKSVIFVAGNVTISEEVAPLEYVQTVREFPTTTVEEATEKLVGEYEII